MPPTVLKTLNHSKLHPLNIPHNLSNSTVVFRPHPILLHCQLPTFAHPVSTPPSMAFPLQSSSAVAFDPVAAFLRRPLEEVVAPLAPPPSSPPTPSPRSLDTLHKLAADHAWASVLDLSATLLAGSEFTPESSPNTTVARRSSPSNSSSSLRPHQRLLCTLYRALALLQTRQLDRVTDILHSLGDLSTLHTPHKYEFYPDEYPGKSGSFVPFELQLLAVEVRIRKGDYSAISDAYILKNQIHDSPTSKSDNQLAVLLSALCSYHLRSQQVDAALDVALQLAHLLNNSHAWYIYGRVLLHVGDINAAETVFTHANHMMSDARPATRDALRHAHDAMILAARARYNEAVASYDDAVRLMDDFDQLAVAVTNNAAVCLIHIGRVAEAVDRLESAIRKNPQFALDEGLLFNLATLYDLAFPDSATEKKHVLRRLASRFGRQGFDLDCVHLQ